MKEKERDQKIGIAQAEKLELKTLKTAERQEIEALAALAAECGWLMPLAGAPLQFHA